MINLNEQKDFTDKLIEDLKPYTQRKVNQLPDNIIQDLHKIKIGPQITTSGIEPVKSILTDLYDVSILLEDAINNPEEFKKDYSNKPLAPNKHPLPTKPTNIDPKATPEIKINIQPEEKTLISQKTINSPKATIQIPIKNKSTNLSPKDSTATNTPSSSVPPPPNSNIKL